MSVILTSTIKSPSGCSPIDRLIESSKIDDEGNIIPERKRLKWISYLELADVEPIQASAGLTIYYAAHYQSSGKAVGVMLLSLGTINTCTREFMHQFAKIYSLPIHKYK